MGHIESSWLILGCFKFEVRSSRLEPLGWGLRFLSFIEILSCFVKVGCLELFLVILRHFGSFEVILGQLKSLGVLLNSLVISYFGTGGSQSLIEIGGVRSMKLSMSRTRLIGVGLVLRCVGTGEIHKSQGSEQ